MKCGGGMASMAAGKCGYAMAAAGVSVV